MRSILSVAIAGLMIVAAADIATAQTRRGKATQQQTQTGNPSGLAPCSERPFARDCDRRGTW